MRVMKCVFGSHLYGTDTPASDKDYKGISLPTWEQVGLGKIPKHIEHSSTGSQHSRNTAEDVDTEIFSLHAFIDLCMEGQTVALDMLHCPENKLIYTTPIWVEIVRNRHMAYSKNIQSFVGYAQRQASKYGIKGSRLNDAEAVVAWLDKQDYSDKLSECDLSTFPSGEHIQYYGDSTGALVPYFDICGKQMQVTNRVHYVIDVMRNFCSKYGARARQAAADEGVDWKAISHAFRAAYQIRELLVHETITFPRPEAEYLTKIKTGQLKYLDIAPELERIIDEVKELQLVSKLPEKADRGFWNTFVLETVQRFITP